MMTSAYAGHSILNIYSYAKRFLSINCGLTNSQLIILTLLTSYYRLFPQNNIVNGILPFVPLICLTFTAPSQEDILYHLTKRATFYEEYSTDGPRAAGYGRVSSNRQVREGRSLEEQQRILFELVEKHKPSVIYGFIDPGKSGKKTENRKLTTIRVLAENHLIDELYLAYVDRMGRNLLECLEFVIALFKNNVRIVTPELIYDRHNLGSIIILVIELYGAEKQNNDRTNKSTASKEGNFLEKSWNKSSVPLGYKKNDQRWVTKLEEYDLMIKQIYTLFLEGQGYSRIRKRINSEYKNLLTEPLKRGRIESVLSDSIYIGKPTHITATVNDSSLQVINIEQYNDAKERIASLKMESIEKIKIDPLGILWEIFGNVFEFLDTISFHHDEDYCKGRIEKNGSRQTDGVWRQTFICKECRKQFLVPSQRNLAAIKDYIGNLNQSNPLNYIKMSKESKTRKKKHSRIKKLGRNDVKLESFFT